MLRIYVLLVSLILVSCTSTQESAESSETSVEYVTTPSQGNASLPHLIRGGDDQLYLSWVEKQDSGWVQFNYSTLTEQGWSASMPIAKGNNWFVNWADYPMMAVDKNGNMIAHYLAKSAASTYSYNVNVVLKPNDSSYWSPPLIPHTDGTPTEHGFVSMIPGGDDTFLVAWLDGRNTGGGDHETHSGGAMTIRSAAINMRGELTNEVELDNRVCDCCQTGMAMTNSGPMVVYRDRSVDEIRDMAFVQQDGESWSEPTLVGIDNWNIAGCPVNGPRIVSSGSTTAVAWFSGANNRPVVKVAFKNEQGFNDPIIVDATNPIGRVDVVVINESNVMVSWMDGGDTPGIKYRRVAASGAMSDEMTLTAISADRGSGFPQMEVHNNTLYFAWTEMGDQNQIRTAKVVIDGSIL